MAPSHQVVMLKFIKNLSMLSSTLDTLQNSNAIEVLTDLLTASMNVSHFKVCSLTPTYILWVAYNFISGNFEPGLEHYVQSL